MNNEIINALNVLKLEGTILCPTDTIWGISCDALSDVAVEKIFKIKKRNPNKPLICLASSFEMIEEYASPVKVDELEDISKELPTTFIFENPKKISKYVTGEMNSIAFRVPNNDFCIDLIDSFGRPIVSTSANISKDKIPSNFSEINSKIKNKVDYIVKHEKNKNSFVTSRILRIKEDGSFITLR
ncbi:MAG: L-threonylcarbamoyladenylate synthase [Flavobacteriaceae bacterium]|nr:L-threonylcarbamoyladenylate synthase [Flavobacteriaceae bacterium]